MILWHCPTAMTIAIAISLASTAAEPSGFLGSQSCATSTCHGSSNTNGPAWTHSLSTHRANDPHATAGLLLLDDDSREIVQRLDPDAKTSEVAFQNVLRTRCISCHATVTPADCQPIGEIPPEILGGGVSCEACHGPADGWVDEHLQRSWVTNNRREQTGFRESKAVLDRAKGCVRCHVGSRTEDGLVRDMNHDLIAAGHPALRFDLLIYHRNLPRHWDADEYSEREFDASSIRVRQVGRAVGLAAAAKLSAARAADHLKDPRSVPWPELADYDCFACHQSLSTLSYRLPVQSVKQSPLHISDGLPVWNAWYSISQMDLRDKTIDLKAFSPLRSDPETLRSRAEEVALDYTEIAENAAAETPSLITTLDETTKMLRERPPVDWHEAAVAYLQIEAIVEDRSRGAMGPFSAQQASMSLPELASLLRFRSASEVTTQTPTQKPNSPARFDAKAFRREALAMFRLQPDAPEQPSPPQSEN